MRTASTSTLLFALGSAVASVSAQPFEGSTSTSGAIAIPLAKRGAPSLTREDGVVDWGRFQGHMARTVMKFVRGSDNFLLNTGERLLTSEPGVIAGVADVHLGRRAWDDMGGSDSLEWGNESSFGLVAEELYDPEPEPVTVHSRAKREIIQDGDDEETVQEKLFQGFRGSGILGAVKNAAKKSKTTTKAKPKPKSSSKPQSSPTPKPYKKQKPTALTDDNAPSSGGISLTDYNNGALWAGTVQIGTPPVSYVLDFDTGSSDLWVPLASCSSSACAPHTKYDPSASSSSTTLAGRQLSLQYGDGSSTTGLVYTDTVSLAGISATGQTLGAATGMSSDWQDDPMDGMMGMAYQSISKLGAPPFFQTLVAEEKVSSPQFSFKIASSGSELYLGGMNPSLFVDGTTVWSPVISQSYWVIKANANVNNKAQIRGFNAIIDSGTSVIVAPTADAATFWSSVPDSAPYGGGSYYTYLCASAPRVSFSFGTSKKWTISADQLNLGKVSSGSDRCVGAIVGADVGVNGWILGDAFMSNVYSTFDLGNNRVGFSQLA